MTTDDLNIVILCPERNSGGLKCTVNSLKIEIPEVPFVTLVGCDTTKDDIINLSKYSRVCKGGKTITSLIDAGIRESRGKWCLIVIAGSVIKQRLIHKYFYFLKSEKDIVFPVVDKKYLFDEASINGIMINKSTYEEVGEFGDGYDNIKESKLLWADRAIAKGCVFKAVVGVRFM